MSMVIFNSYFDITRGYWKVIHLGSLFQDQTNKSACLWVPKSPHGDAFLDLQSHWVQLLDVVRVAENEGLGRIEATRDDVLRKPCIWTHWDGETQQVLGIFGGRKSRRNTPTNTHWLVVSATNMCHWSSQPAIPRYPKYGTLWWTNILPWTMAIDIVDFPINSMVIFHCYVSSP